MPRTGTVPATERLVDRHRTGVDVVLRGREGIVGGQPAALRAGSESRRRLHGNARRPDRPPEYDSNTVFPGGRHTTPKVRAFVDFLVQRPDFDADCVLARCPLQAAYAKPSEPREDGPASSTGILRTATIDARDELAEPMPTEDALA